MDEDVYIIDCMDGLYACWTVLGLLLGGGWLLAPIYLTDKPFSFRYYIEPDSFVFLSGMGFLFIITWLVGRRFKYEISASKIICRNGKKITHSINTTEIQGIVKKGSVRLKVENQPDFTFDYILFKKKEDLLLDALHKIGINEL